MIRFITRPVYSDRSLVQTPPSLPPVVAFTKVQGTAAFRAKCVKCSLFSTPLYFDCSVLYSSHSFRDSDVMMFTSIEPIDLTLESSTGHACDVFLVNVYRTVDAHW